MPDAITKTQKTQAQITADELREELEITRAKVAAAAAGLRDELKEKTDWRAWVGKHPWRWVGGALVAGALLAILTNDEDD